MLLYVRSLLPLLHSGLRVCAVACSGPERVAISTLLAVGRVHHHLVRTQARSRIGLLAESAEAREVHQICTLIGYGADGICPYLAFETLAALREDGQLAASESDDALATKFIKVQPLMAFALLKYTSVSAVTSKERWALDQKSASIGLATLTLSTTSSASGPASLGSADPATSFCM